MPSNYPLLRNLTQDLVPNLEAVVSGKIPTWLNGTLFRNGPGRYEFGKREYKHLFDGHACVHKFKIDNGRVFYSNKFLQTESFKYSSKNKTLSTGFGDSDPCTNLLGRFQAFYRDSLKIDNTNVNIVPYGNDQLYALTETNMICQVDPVSLDIKKSLNISEYLNDARSTIAHPHIEEDGSWITMGINKSGKEINYNFIRFKNNRDIHKNMCENGEIIAQIPSSHKMAHSYFHSFAISQNYIIFLEMALVFDIKKYLMGIFTNKAFADSLTMIKDFPTHIHLINRKTGKVLKQKILTDPMFVFHHINSYEVYDENNNIKEINIDLCAYDVSFDIKRLTYKNSFHEKFLETKPVRIVLPMNNSKSDLNQVIHCKVEDINQNLAFEFPVINYDRFNTKPYTYFYGTNIYNFPFSVIKQNVVNKKEVLEFKYEGNDKKHFPSEPIFVERPGATSEDDGVLLVMVLAEDRDFLSILNAKDLKEIARAELPQDIKGATTFHGFFASKDQFSGF